MQEAATANFQRDFRGILDRENGWRGAFVADVVGRAMGGDLHRRLGARETRPRDGSRRVSNSTPNRH